MKRKQFAVIGIGRFGESLICELAKMGHEVLAIDRDEDRIEDIADIATHAVQADATEKRILKSLDITSFDAVIVAIGGDIEASILTTITLQELGVKRIIAKAQSAMHGKVLQKMGVDLLLYPERDMAIRLARTMVSTNIIEQIELSHRYGILELRAPRSFLGRSLSQIRLRNKMDVTILAVKSGEKIKVSPAPDYSFKEGDILVALGPNQHLERLSEIE